MIERLSVSRLILLAILLTFFQNVEATDIITVTGESTFYDDGTHSRIECMRLALEQARIDALARNFGTIVSQDILQSDRIVGNREHNDFLSLTSTEVKGEWVADEGDPKYTFERDAEENLIVTCVIKGKAKSISNESAEFKSAVLRNGTDHKNADINFKDGDSMFLDFEGSQNGYLAVFLEDEKKNVFQLLPYTTDSKSIVPVVKGQRYVFFSPVYANRGEQVDELVLTASFNTEYNRVYVLFSPRQFSSPVMHKEPGSLPWMNSEDFSKWVVRTRKNDASMGVKAMNLIISPSR